MRKNRRMDEWIQIPLCNCGEKLYHYTTAEGVQGIVADRRFVATKSDFLNDKLEFVYALEVMEELLERYLANEELKHTFLAMLRAEIQRLGIIAPACDKNCQEDAMSFYVVAFSKLQNSALLWAEFTDFKGYFLEFDYEQLADGFSGRAFLHGTVIYDEEKQRNCLLEALLSCVRGGVAEGRADLEGFFDGEELPSEESLREVARDMAMICSVYAMFFKKAFFAGEEEYRFVFSPLLGSDEKEKRPRFRIQEQVFLPYIMVEYDSKGAQVPLESVTVGAKNNSDIAVRGVRYFLKGEGLEIPVLLSDIPLRY